jgi:cation transport protein ChaC
MPMEDDGDLWVFAYGSLMWRPGFVFLDRRLATLRGHHRSLCIYSHVHRGTPETPGLVLGLDRGGSCRGVAYRVKARLREETVAYLRARELVTQVYREAVVRVALDGGPSVKALVYLVDRTHAQYAGRLTTEAMLAHVRQGVGQSGRNVDYVRATHDHLVDLGLTDATLAWIAAAIGAEASA